jgi:dTDP-4-dehydrorhamnose reductase
MRKMLELACERDSLELVADQVGAPTGAELVADVTGHALMLSTARDGPTGTYHLAARGETTWHAYGCFIVGEARRAGWAVRLADEAIAPVATDAFPRPARRPRNSRLCVDRLEQTFGLRLPQWRPGVARAVEECAGACKDRLS